MWEWLKDKVKGCKSVKEHFCSLVGGNSKPTVFVLGEFYAELEQLPTLDATMTQLPTLEATMTQLPIIKAEINELQEGDILH